MGPPPNIFIMGMLIEAYARRHARAGGRLPAEHQAPEPKKTRQTDANQPSARAGEARWDV
jgi:hypothetical protein